MTLVLFSREANKLSLTNFTHWRKKGEITNPLVERSNRLLKQIKICIKPDHFMIFIAVIMGQWDRVEV